MRVIPELVDARPGQAPHSRWGEQFDAAMTDVFQVQGDIAAKVADALGVALADSTQRELAAKPTENLAAYDEYLKGEAASQAMGVSDPPTLRRAIGLLPEAPSRSIPPSPSRGPVCPTRRSASTATASRTPRWPSRPGCRPSGRDA